MNNELNIDYLIPQTISTGQGLLDDGYFDGRSISFAGTSIVSDINGNSSSIIQNATDIALNVTDIAGNSSSIIQNATNIELRVEKDDVINQINISSEGILIDADNIEISGTTTFLSGYDPSTKETPAGAQTKVDTLGNTLGNMAFEDLVGLAKLDTTVISGGYVKTSLLTADNIIVGTLRGLNITAPVIKTAIAIDLTGDFTVTTATDKFNDAYHGLWVGNTIKVATTGTLPAPLVAGTIYYVVAKTDNTFQVSLTRGGTVVNITSTGSGTHTWTRNTVRSVVLDDDDGLLVKDNAVTRVQIYDYYARFNDEFGNDAGRIYGDVLSGDKVMIIQTDYLAPTSNNTTYLGWAGRSFQDIYSQWGHYSYLETSKWIDILPTGVPASAVDGRIYYNAAQGELRIRLEGSWWRFNLTLL